MWVIPAERRLRLHSTIVYIVMIDFKPSEKILQSKPNRKNNKNFINVVRFQVYIIFVSFVFSKFRFHLFKLFSCLSVLKMPAYNVCERLT